MRTVSTSLGSRAVVEFHAIGPYYCAVLTLAVAGEAYRSDLRQGDDVFDVLERHDRHQVEWLTLLIRDRNNKRIKTVSNVMRAPPPWKWDLSMFGVDVTSMLVMLEGARATNQDSRQRPRWFSENQSELNSCTTSWGA